MKKYEIAIGDKFGQLEVVGITNNNSTRNIICKCDCGKEYIAIRNHLVIGKTKSCGCKRGVQDLSGKRFGKLLVQEFDHSEKGTTFYKCICDCGNTTVKSRVKLNNGDAKSCGCLHPRIPDMIGEKFGRLTVQELVKAEKGQKWYKCLCDCGNEKIIDGHSLRRGHTTSCGCTKDVDLTGKVFERLTVVERDYSTGIKMWKCLCICGNTTITKTSALLEGSTKSCGCLNIENIHRTRTLDMNEKQIYAVYKDGAAKRGLEFNISYDKFLEISKMNCHYCGSEPSNICSAKYRKDSFIYNGLDRVDNSVGYINDNIVTCCKNCNMMKSTKSVGEFLETAINIAQNHKIQKIDYTMTAHSIIETRMVVLKSCITNTDIIRNKKSALNSLLRRYKSGAKNRKLLFELDTDSFFSLISNNCFYCGREPEQVQKYQTKNYHINFTYNGIDRLNNSLGYTRYNSVPCCSRCNSAKGVLSSFDFVKHAELIVKYQQGDQN